MASKPKTGTKFTCVLVFETEISTLDEMTGVIEALEEAEQTLGDVGDCRIAGDRFLMPPLEDEKPATTATVPAKVEDKKPDDDPMAVKMI